MFSREPCRTSYIHETLARRFERNKASKPALLILSRLEGLVAEVDADVLAGFGAGGSSSDVAGTLGDDVRNAAAEGSGNLDASLAGSGALVAVEIDAGKVDVLLGDCCELVDIGG